MGSTNSNILLGPLPGRDPAREHPAKGRVPPRDRHLRSSRGQSAGSQEEGEGRGRGASSPSGRGPADVRGSGGTRGHCAAGGGARAAAQRALPLPARLPAPPPPARSEPEPQLLAHTTSGAQEHPSGAARRRRGGFRLRTFPPVPCAL